METTLITNGADFIGTNFVKYFLGSILWVYLRGLIS
jgi:dTDP-D-glucose 4,6-dehydratase